jgi:hypothetical protein
MCRRVGMASLHGLPERKLLGTKRIAITALSVLGLALTGRGGGSTSASTSVLTASGGKLCSQDALKSCATYSRVGLRHFAGALGLAIGLGLVLGGLSVSAPAYAATLSFRVPAAVRAGGQAYVVVELRQRATSCSLVVRSAHHTQRVTAQKASRRSLRWSWTVPAQAKSATWRITVSCKRRKASSKAMTIIGSAKGQLVMWHRAPQVTVSGKPLSALTTPRPTNSPPPSDPQDAFGVLLSTESPVIGQQISATPSVPGDYNYQWLYCYKVDGTLCSIISNQTTQTITVSGLCPANDSEGAPNPYYLGVVVSYRQDPTRGGSTEATVPVVNPCPAP